MPAHIEAEITSWKTLNEMRFLPIQRRLELIFREHGIMISGNTLSRLYKRNGVRYLQAKKLRRQSVAANDRLERERVRFAGKLAAL